MAEMSSKAICDFRIGSADCSTHSCAGSFFNVPRHLYPNGDDPKLVFGSRDFFERMLRHLVASYSERVRFMAGTVTGLVADESDAKRIGSVTVSIAGGDKSVGIPAALVVGTCRDPFANTYLELNYYRST